MNVTNLILNLKSKIGDATIDQQMLSKAIKLLELGTIESVSSFSSLPNAATTGRDKLYLVEFDGLYKTNGTYWAPFAQDFSPAFSWGCNTCGPLGDGTTVDKSSPVSVVGGFTDWCQVDAGHNHSLGVRTNGTAWAWGQGTNGRLGDNTNVSKSSPVLVSGGFSDWCQVSVGYMQSIGVRQNGTAWAWGAGIGGQLGDNTIVDKSSPVSVVGGITDWCQVSAGECYNLGVRQGGGAWAWGSAINGKLGDGTTVGKSSPVLVAGGFSDWCQVDAGNYHSLGVRQNGTAWAWGTGCRGQVGDGTTVNKSSPVLVVGGFTDWCQVSAGFVHSIGVRQNGTLWAWGQGVGGLLGDNTVVAKSSPVSVVGGFTDWCQVSAGGVHSLGIRTNGTAWAWGCGTNGRLGDNTTVNKSSPVLVSGGFSDWCQVSTFVTSAAIRRTNV